MYGVENAESQKKSEAIWRGVSEVISGFAR